MQPETSNKPVSPRRTRNDLVQFNQSPPRTKLTGLLTPTTQNGRVCGFTLETDKDEYLLRMNSEVAWIAKKLEWEEVIVWGHFDFDARIFDVEKISRISRREHFAIYPSRSDLAFDLDHYKKAIEQLGVLDFVQDYRAS